ncbi:hypothetical protein [Amaricoccus solimangrovi]|uniref:Uncharacterized protein n=1 Tax=Amaricoccus solimangrovi TaxID=2589815 RepID=A0A501WX74_9RHOB|nr:hypothetical protein [Amaricoccus solimangrovi]TPE53050.1 hypothetical protein FJM51_03220 [Amaricoccus solimangrovi]
MKSPKPVNLTPPAEIRAAGWEAEARDDDGHLMTTHAPFSSDAEALRYLRESLDEGWTVTIFPKGSAR